ncbi:MAG: hypothetical protein GY861_17830 [bacterium]|nr:hypothetical protein [bacterium]
MGFFASIPVRSNGEDIEHSWFNTIRTTLENYVATLVIGDLNDVDTTTTAPVDQDVLTWNDSNSEWEPQSAVRQINDLSDVDTTTVAPTDGQLLGWNNSNSEWEPKTVVAGALNPTVKTATGTISISETMVLASSTGGAITLTLPAVSGNDGKEIIIQKTSSDFNVITIDADGSEFIGGSATTTLNTQGETIRIVCHESATNWVIIDRLIPSIQGSYVPSVNTGTKGTTTTDNAYYWRDGRFLYIDYRYVQTAAGSSGSQFYTWTIPSGLAIDSTLQPVGSNGISDIAFSSCAVFDGGASAPYLGVCGAFNTTQFYMEVMNDTQVPDFVGLTSGIGNFGDTAIRYSASLRVPISGWKG